MKFYSKSPYDKKKIKIEIKPSDIVIPPAAKTILEVALANHREYLKSKLGFSDLEVEKYLAYKICSIDAKAKSPNAAKFKWFGIGILIPSVFSFIYWAGRADMRPIQFTFMAAGMVSLFLAKMTGKNKKKSPYNNQVAVIDGFSNEKMGKAEVSYDACYNATVEAVKQKKLNLKK